MITGRHRFHGYGSLKGVYQRGNTVRGGLLNIRYVLRDPKRPYRVAVVVSRKVNKSAVTRNRIRRRLYEIVRNNDSIIAPGTDIVFTVFDDQLADIEYTELSSKVYEMLKKIA